MYSVPAFSLNTPVQPGYRSAATGAAENEKPMQLGETDTFTPSPGSDAPSGASTPPPKPPPNTPAEPNGAPLSQPAFPMNQPFPMTSANALPQPAQNGLFWPGSALPALQDTWHPSAASPQTTASKSFPLSNEPSGLKTLSATQQRAGNSQSGDSQTPEKGPNAPLPPDPSALAVDSPTTTGAEQAQHPEMGEAGKVSAKGIHKNKAEKNKPLPKSDHQDAKADQTASLPVEAAHSGKKSSNPKTNTPESDAKPENISETASEATPAEKSTSIFSRFVEARQVPSETDKPTSKSKKHESETASKMVAAYKILFAVCGVGFMNAFLFGSPLLVSIGLALGFAGAQSYLALKVAKEDNWISKGMMAMSRWLTGSQNDQSQSGKERAMAPVWAIVSSGLALIEAGMNIGGKSLASKFSSVGKLGFQERSIDSVLAGLLNKQKAQPGGLVNLQVKTVSFVKQLSERIQGIQRDMLHHIQDEATATGLIKTRNNLIRFVADTSPFFRNARGLMWAGVSGFVGGYVLSILAAKVHENFGKKFQNVLPETSPNSAA